MSVAGKVQAALSKLGLPCAFRGKIVFIAYLEETYKLFKKTDGFFLYIFFGRINVIVTSQSNAPYEKRNGQTHAPFSVKYNV